MIVVPVEMDGVPEPGRGRGHSVDCSHLFERHALLDGVKLLALFYVPEHRGWYDATMTTRQIEVEVLEPAPGHELVASVELLTTDPGEYAGLRLATRVVARRLRAFSIDPAAELIIRISTLSRRLGLECEVVLRALRELEARQIILFDLHDLPPPRRTCPGRWAKVRVCN